MLQKSTRGGWEKLRIDRIALNFSFYCNFLKVVTLLLWKVFFFLLRNITKMRLVFFVILLNKIWILCIKAKLLLLKSCYSEKKFQSNSINFKLCSTPSGGFLKHPEVLQQIDYMRKISKVSIYQGINKVPGGLNFVFFYFQMNSVTVAKN